MNQYSCPNCGGKSFTFWTSPDDTQSLVCCLNCTAITWARNDYKLKLDYIGVPAKPM